MNEGKTTKLRSILHEVMTKGRCEIIRCVVTNERGLIVVELAIDESSNETLAAMMSLLSDAAKRINMNLNLSVPLMTSVRTQDEIVSMREFVVRNRQFRIGAVASNSSSRWPSFFGRGTSVSGIEDTLRKAASVIRDILEESSTV